jgi:hypothetical protein
MIATKKLPIVWLCRSNRIDCRMVAWNIVKVCYVDAQCMSIDRWPWSII